MRPAQTSPPPQGTSRPAAWLTSATFIWMDAWSLAPMMRLLAELRGERSERGRGSAGEGQGEGSAAGGGGGGMQERGGRCLPFPRHVQVHELAGVVLHVEGASAEPPAAP